MSGEDQTVGLLASPPSPVIPADSGGVEAGDIPGVPNNTRTDNPLPGLSARNNSNSTRGTEPHASADDVLSNKLSPSSELASLRLGPLPDLPAGGLSAVASSAGRQPAPFKSSSDVAHLVQREKVLGRVDSASYVKRASEGTIDVSSPAGSRMAVHFPHASFSHHTGSAVRCGTLSTSPGHPGIGPKRTRWVHSGWCCGASSSGGNVFSCAGDSGITLARSFRSWRPRRTRGRRST
jgi:hypothetical protein